MKTLTFCAAFVLIASSALAEPLSFKEARKALPRANAKPVVEMFQANIPETDKARLGGTDKSVEKLLRTLGTTVPAYGAVAISPSEGLFVEWLNGAGQFHSLAAARAAALDYCDSNRKRGSAPCEIVVLVTPKGAKADAALTLSGPANAALRKDYRKLQAPKAFAISEKTGNFGFARGDGGRALSRCEAGGQGASDCKIVVSD
ncbi:MAG: 5-aminolevulic acid synthase [Pseudomonadota bacterium]